MAKNQNREELSTSSSNPNEQLAMKITKILMDNNLIKKESEEELLSKLKLGGVSIEEWNQWANFATSPQEIIREEKNG